jgi:hypothetical protein
MPLSTFLNGTDPVRLRGLLFLSLSDSGQVLSRTATSDSGGGATYVWAAGSAVPCRIDPLGSDESRVVGGRIDESSTHLVTVPPGTEVATGNRFAITGRGTFEVTAARQQTGEWATTFEVAEAS